MQRDIELAAWVRLTQVPGLGGQTLRKLLARFGPPAQVFAAGSGSLATVVGSDLAERIATCEVAHTVEEALRWAAAPRHHIVPLGDALYPQRLLEIHDPPPLLYINGDATLLARPCVAVVGSRNGTPQGLANATSLARALSAAGVTIVSGLALGIDAAAHRGALDEVGSTIAVLGCGADVVYPPRNAALHAAIADRGALVTEYPLATPPVAANFPRRNRLISGLAHGVIVVEAALSSGALITARLAVEQGRDVFAVPGSIHSPLAKGCHALIKDGAKLVESAVDVLGELQLPGLQSPRNAPQPVAKGHALLPHLGYDPCNVDSLCQRSGLTPETVSAMLLELELDGLVASLPGGRYQRVV